MLSVISTQRWLVESTLIKVMSQCRFVDISEQKQFELSDTCLYFVVDGFVRVSGSAQMSMNHQVGKSLMKEKFSGNGMVSMVDASSFPSRLENTLKRKLARKPKILPISFDLSLVRLSFTSPFPGLFPSLNSNVSIGKFLLEIC